MPSESSKPPPRAAQKKQTRSTRPRTHRTDRQSADTATTAGGQTPASGAAAQVDVAAVRATGAATTHASAQASTGNEPPKAKGGQRRGRRGGRRRSAAKSGDAPAKAPGRDSEATAPAATPASGEDAKARGTRRRSRGRRRKQAPADAGRPKDTKAQPPADQAEPKDADEAAVHDEDVESLPQPTQPLEDEAADFIDFDANRADLKKPGSRAMVINVSGEDECRIAILADGRLEELFIERGSAQSLVGNIYKGRITNVEPSIQAVFVEFGLPKHGFLHVSDVQPQYFPDHKGALEEVGRKIPRHQRPPIQKCFRRGQAVLVQVTKQGVGTKGPTLTTYLSIPGQYLVMLPGMSRHGVSRKIEDDTLRRRMREVLGELTLPSGVGFILRTAGLDKTKRELQRDLNYLTRLWKTITGRIRELPAPAEVYRESDLITRTLRDIYTSDFNRIIVDDLDAAKRARSFLQLASPRSKPNIEVYSRREPLFHRLGIEEEIERISSRHVPLPSGGSLVIDQTEALVAIDVNSGRFRRLDDAEETALQINMEAAEEIARQLRLRDLGGLIVCDFIDMRMDRNKRKVERAMRDALKRHKERARILRMSAFGLIEITRQRQGPSIRQNIYLDCPHCRGSGLIKTPESVILDVIRTVQLASQRTSLKRIIITLAPDVAFQVLNRKRSQLNKLEAETGKVITITGDPHFTADRIECTGEDERGQIIPIEPGDAQ